MTVDTNSPEFKRAVDLAVLTDRYSNSEPTLFDALDCLKPEANGELDLTDLQREAVNNVLAAQDDGGVGLMRRYAEQRYLGDHQPDYDQTHATAYLQANLPDLGVPGTVQQVLDAEPAPPLSPMNDVVGTGDVTLPAPTVGGAQ